MKDRTAFGIIQLPASCGVVWYECLWFMVLDGDLCGPGTLCIVPWESKEKTMK